MATKIIMTATKFMLTYLSHKFYFYPVMFQFFPRNFQVYFDLFKESGRKEHFKKSDTCTVVCQQKFLHLNFLYIRTCHTIYIRTCSGYLGKIQAFIHRFLLYPVTEYMCKSNSVGTVSSAVLQTKLLKYRLDLFYNMAVGNSVCNTVVVSPQQTHCSPAWYSLPYPIIPYLINTDIIFIAT